MKMLSILAAAVLSLTAMCVFADKAAPGKAAPAEYYAVQVFGLDGRATNFMMTAAELDAVTKQVDAESKVLKKAIQLAEEEWKSEGVTKSKAFPKSAISARKVKSTKFMDVNKAQDKVSSLIERQQKKDDDEVKIRTKMQQDMRMDQDTIKSQEKKLKEEESKDSLARTMVQNKIVELLSAAASNTSSNKAPAQAAAKTKDATK